MKYSQAKSVMRLLENNSTADSEFIRFANEKYEDSFLQQLKPILIGRFILNDSLPND